MTTRALADAISVATTAAKGVVRLAADGGTTAGQAVQASDGRLDDARTPVAHVDTHAWYADDPLTAAHLGDGTASVATVLRGDLTWGAPSGGAPSGAAGGVLGGTYPNPSFAADMATQAELDAHTGDASAAHAASAIAFTPTGTIAATDVQAALAEVASEAAAGSYTDEQARDALATALVGGTGITITPNDGADTITITATGGTAPAAHATTHAAGGSDPLTLTAAQISDLTEASQDIVGALIAAAGGSYNDGAGTIALPAAYTDENARDAIGAALVAGTGITVTPNDGADTITIAATVSAYTDEQAQDAVGNATTATGGGLAYAYNDAGNALGFTLTQDVAFGVEVDNNSTVLPTGYLGQTPPMPFAGTIQEVTLLGDVSGSATVDIWKDSYANYPPTVADTITASDKPSISATTKATKTSFTGWTLTFAVGDVLRFNLDSVTTMTRLLVGVRARRT